MMCALRSVIFGWSSPALGPATTETASRTGLAKDVNTLQAPPCWPRSSRKHLGVEDSQPKAQKSWSEPRMPVEIKKIVRPLSKHFTAM